MAEFLLCHQHDIAENQAKAFSIATEQDQLELFVIKYDNQIYGYKNHCPHLGIPLNWQPDQFLSQEGNHIQCSTHGALFEPETGHCIAGPCTGQNLQRLVLQQKEDGSIFLQYN